MNKSEQLKALYQEIFGPKIEGYNYDDPTKSICETIDKTKIARCNKCNRKKFRQDAPYYKKNSEVDYFVVAESPGSGPEKGEIGYIFNWFGYFQTPQKCNRKEANYFNYLRNIYGLNLSKIYLTDAIKCYTDEGYNDAFKICKGYLKREIEILEPKKIIWMPSSIDRNLIIPEYDKIIIDIPHLSNQNTSKIPTVCNILECIAEINLKLSPEKRDKLNNIAGLLTKEYSWIVEELHKDN